MKKMLFVAVMLMAGIAKADMVSLTLLEHVMPVTQFRSGETRIALVDSIVQIGSYNGKSILDLQAGFNGDTKPEAGEVSGANLIGGGFLKVSSLISSSVHYPERWRFLQSVEHGPFVNYDFREKNWFGGYQAGLAFSLSPK